MGFRTALLNLKASVDARYGWWLVAIGVVVLTTAGDTLYTSLVAMLHSGLPATPRATIVWTISAIAQSRALLLPLVGMVVDRFGSRPTMVAGLSLCAVAAILAAALADTRATLVLAPALTVGMVAGTNLPVMAAINRWFHLRKALAVAAVLFAVSALAYPLSLASAIPGDRVTTLVFGVLVLALALPLAGFVRQPEAGIQRQGRPAQPSEPDPNAWTDGGPSVDYPWREAVKTWEFWLLVVGAAGVGAVDMLSRTLAFSLADYRFDVAGSYQMFENTHQVASVAFILIGGLATTRLKLRTALLGFATLYLVALATLLLANGPGWAFAGIALLGAGHGGGTALTIAAIGEYFGRRRFATLLGTYWLVSGALQTGIFGLLFAIRPWLNYFGVSVEVPGVVGMALVPAALSAAAYWKLGDPKPALSQIQ